MYTSEFLATLEDETTYRRYFMDAGCWRPYVLQVCHRHGLEAHGDVRPGLAGSFKVMPSVASQMYFPEVFGRSDGRLLSIGR